MSYNRHINMVNSGQVWVGDIPSHWSLKRISQVFRQRSEKVSDSDYPPLSVTKSGIVPQLDHVAKTDDNDNRKLVRAGDFVINSRSDRKGSAGIAAQDGSVSLINTILVPDQSIDPVYCHHLFRCTAFQEEFYRMGSGLVADLWSTNFSKMKFITCALPPKTEQNIIGRFLDIETARIDTLIAKKERFIELLKEKRAAIITRAVTKGIDRGALLTDSGVEWIGQVPNSWNLTKLGQIGRSANGINIGGEAFGHGFPFISYGDVYRNRELPKVPEGLVASTLKDQITYSVEPGDILFTRTSETIDEIAFPSVCVQKIENAVFAGFLIRFRPYKGHIVPLFAKYAFQSSGIRHFFAKEMKLVTRASLSQRLLHSLPLPLPPLQQQEDIAAYLEDQTSKLENLIVKTNESVVLLKERRTALITAAVTGKIDVRAHASKNLEAAA